MIINYGMEIHRIHLLLYWKWHPEPKSPFGKLRGSFYGGFEDSWTTEQYLLFFLKKSKQNKHLRFTLQCLMCIRASWSHSRLQLLLSHTQGMLVQGIVWPNLVYRMEKGRKGCSWVFWGVRVRNLQNPGWSRDLGSELHNNQWCIGLRFKYSS